MIRLLALTALLVAAITFTHAKELFPQSKQLEEGILIRLEDAWIYDQKTEIELLRALFTYQGADPNEKYRISAFLEADGERIDSQYVWQAGAPKTEEYRDNELPMIWEFRDFPHQAKTFRLTLMFTQASDPEQVKSIEYVLPRPQKLRSRDGTVNKNG